MTLINSVKTSPAQAVNDITWRGTLIHEEELTIAMQNDSPRITEFMTKDGLSHSVSPMDGYST